MSIGRRGGLLVLAALLSPCGRDGDAGRQGAPSGASGPQAADAQPADEGESAGRTLYRRACVMCHGERGAGTQLGSALNDRARTADEVVRAVTEGVPQAEPPRTPMPRRGDGTFTDAEVRTVAEYVHGLAR
jgi:mono/diheme cytochrome c family protein